MLQWRHVGWPRRQGSVCRSNQTLGDRRGTNLEGSLVVVELWFRAGVMEDDDFATMGVCHTTPGRAAHGKPFHEDLWM